MNNIGQTSAIVKQVLEEVPATRNSDDLLYIKVCSRINPNALRSPFSEVLCKRKELNLPPFESVRRSRQKLQADFPELAAVDSVEYQRVVNESIVRNYARKRG